MRRARIHNRELVLRCVADSGPRSRAALALETGLNKSTVSSVVAELVDAGLLRETPDAVDERPRAVGRPPRDVELDPDGPLALGLEINVDYLAAWASGLGGQPQRRRFLATENRAADPQEVVAELLRLVDETLGESSWAGRTPAATTVAVPGLVGREGRVVAAPNLGWLDVPLRELLPAEVDPQIENEANLGALAELIEGAGRGLRNFVYVSGEVGIGAGIVLGGELFRGASGFAGEFGHLTIDPGGPPCRCGGRGCLERLAGQEALLRLAGWDARMERAGQRPGWPGAMLAQRARQGDPRTLQAITQVGHTLGIAIASLANLLDPQAVLLGGYFAPLAEWLTPPIEAELETRLLARGGVRRQLLAAQLGDEAAVRGALADSRRRALESAAVEAGA